MLIDYLGAMRYSLLNDAIRRLFMMKELIRDILNRRDYGSELVVNGWVRTRRDSKGGFSFLEINDGSCFANIQVVAGENLANYTSEVMKHTEEEGRFINN